MNQTEITKLLSVFSCMAYNNNKGATLRSIGRMASNAIDKINEEGLK